MGNWDSWLEKQTSIESFIDSAQVQKLEATLDRAPSLASGDKLPPAWHWLYFHEQAKASDLGHDGHTKLGVSMPNFPLPRRMWAGGNIKWHNQVEIGKEAKRNSKILSIEEKSGRTGDLIFVTVEHQIHQSGRLCIQEEHNIVYRSAAKQSSTAQPEIASTDSDFQASWKLDETTLFRYSALTFNSHRIHYDVNYTREVEGYAGLIVHGPLLATLLLDLAKQNNCSFNEFEYRAKSPVTLPNGFTVHGKRELGQTNLWIANENGALAMQGILR
ncbi:MAG: hypothetical protein RL355_98 [Actinomycetota bacterium]|jgi:3-methylfumaryl-CoA hydratase